MTDARPLHGMAARFDDETALLAAVRHAVGRGWRVEAYTPYPVPGLSGALRHRDPWPFLALCAGFVLGAGLTFLLQWYSVAVSYPINVGGRDLVAWEAFAVSAFEMGVLGAVATSVLAMLWRNRLPSLYHPIFWYTDAWRTSGSAYVLCIEDDGRRFDANAVRAFLRDHGGRTIREVPQ